MNRTGKCLCGAVSFEIRDAATEYGACHCKMCQRWAGSALLGLGAPSDRITISGKENIATFQSSPWAERAWCSKCGSGLWYRITPEDSAHKDTRFLPIGLLDDSSGLKMESEIFVDEQTNAFKFEGEENRTRKTGAEVMAEIAPEK